MKTDIPFDAECAATHIKTLHELMNKVNSGADAETWQETANRLYVLLDAMEPFVNVTIPLSQPAPRYWN